MNMKNPDKTAYIIGNGGSRKGFDLLLLKGKGTVFGCNALYRDYQRSTPKYVLPDYLVAIDNPIITEIESSDFPSSRVLIPPEDEKWEPVELHWGRAVNKQWDPQRPRSNAGMNAILEAIKLEYETLYVFGFDFLVVDQNTAMSNLYDGTDCYGLETRATLNDTRNRMKYLGHVIENNPKTNFVFCYPKETIAGGIYNPQAENTCITSFDDLIYLLSE
jgi:hypothetical protein